MMGRMGTVEKHKFEQLYFSYVLVNAFFKEKISYSLSKEGIHWNIREVQLLKPVFL